MSLFRFVRTTVLMLVLLACTDGQRVVAAADSVAPISLVSDQAAVCLEIPRIEANWLQFQRSRLMTRLKQFPPIERLLTGAGLQQWARVEEHVRRATGKSLSEQLLRAFSESIVVAIYVPEGMSPQGVLIAQARDADALKQTLHAWALLEPQHESQAKEHRGHPYTRRAKSATSADVVYYATFGRTVALSDHERLIHEVIELHAAGVRKAAGAADRARVLGDSSLYRENRSRLPVDAVAYLFLNARMWDRIVDEAIAKSPDARWVQPAFRQIAAVATSLRLNDEVVFDLVADVTGGPLPPAWRQFTAGTAGGRDWNSRIPAEAILAVSSRVEIGPLIQSWLAASADARTDDFARGRNLALSLLQGRDLFADVLPLILRDWTVFIHGTDADDPANAPLNLTGRFSLASVQANERQPVIESLDHALQFGMTLLAASLSHQRGARGEPVIVKSQRSESSVLRTLAGLNPWSPGYQLAPLQLNVSTSWQEPANQRPRDSLAVSKGRLAVNEQRYFGSATQLAWLDAVRLRGVLGHRGEWLAKQVASDSESSERVRKHLAKIEEVTRIFDAAFLAAGFHEDHVRITFGVSLDRSE